jgi:hypothetical protein
MRQSKVSLSWCRLVGWGAVFFGFGALFGDDARAKFGLDHPAAGRAERLPAANEVLVRTIAGKVYLSSNGRVFEELELGETSEAAYLRNLLMESGASQGPISIPAGSIIVANGGGAGNGDKPTQAEAEPASEKQSTGTVSTPRSTPASDKTGHGESKQKPTPKAK